MEPAGPTTVFALSPGQTSASDSHQEGYIRGVPSVAVAPPERCDAFFLFVLDFFSSSSSSLLLPPRARLVTPGELGNAHPSNSTGLRRSSPPRHWLPRRRARPCELSLKVVAKARRNYRTRVPPVASRVSPFAHTFLSFSFFAGQVSPTYHRFGSALRTVTVPHRHTHTVSARCHWAPSSLLCRHTHGPRGAV